MFFRNISPGQTLETAHLLAGEAICFQALLICDLAAFDEFGCKDSLQHATQKKEEEKKEAITKHEALRQQGFSEYL